MKSDEMDCKGKLENSLRMNIGWFRRSGVMVPEDGGWGVAERIALKGNSSMEKIYRSFPAWTEFEKYSIPAEHYEAPVGSHLADTIYTVNWALMGFQILYSVNGQEKYRKAFVKLLDLMVDIQDKSPEKHVKGCWRGMYDLKAGNWGGGDCYEGGANSIYTGWTNAPIAICIAFELLGRSLANRD